MEQDFDYYFISISFEAGMTRLVNDDRVDPGGTSFTSMNVRMPHDHTVHLTLGPPVANNPNFDTDGLMLEGRCTIFSKRIADAVSGLDVQGIQFIPVVIKGRNGKPVTGFCLANICNEPIASFDPEKTEYDEICELTETWIGVEKIVLDREKLSKIPLEERLVFEAQEHPSFILYHRKVVDAMLAVGTRGLVFTPVEEWQEGMF